MAVCYKKLFHLMIDRSVTPTALAKQAGFSANILTRLRRNRYVSLDSIEKVCAVLQCGVDDVLEFVPQENNATPTGKED